MLLIFTQLHPPHIQSKKSVQNQQQLAEMNVYAGQANLKTHKSKIKTIKKLKNKKMWVSTDRLGTFFESEHIISLF